MLRTLYTVLEAPSTPPSPSPLASGVAGPARSEPEQTTSASGPDATLLGALQGLTLAMALPCPSSPPVAPGCTHLEAVERRIMRAFDDALARAQAQWAGRVAWLEDENEQLCEHVQVQQAVAQAASDRFEARLARMVAEHHRERGEWAGERARLRGEVEGGQGASRVCEGNTVGYVLIQTPGASRLHKKRRVSWADEAEGGAVAD